MEARKILRSLESYLTEQKKENTKFLKGLTRNACHKTKLNEGDITKNHIRAVLKAACIEEEKYIGRFFNAPITIYDFLKELAYIQKNKLLNEDNSRLNDRHDDVNCIIADIDAVKKRNKILFNGLLIFFAVGQCAPLILTHSPDILRAITMVSNYLPPIAALYTIGIGLYTFYQVIASGADSFKEKFYENFFLLSSIVLNITGYAVVAAVSLTSPVAGVLFVSASLMQACLEVVRYITLHSKMQQELKPIEMTGQTYLENGQQLLRRTSESTRLLRNIAFNIGAAILMVAVVAVWCFVPGTFLLSIAATILLNGTINHFKTSYNKSSKKQLLTDFERLEAMVDDQPKNVNHSTSGQLDKTADPKNRWQLEQCSGNFRFFSWQDLTTEQPKDTNSSTSDRTSASFLTLT